MADSINLEDVHYKLNTLDSTLKRIELDVSEILDIANETPPTPVPTPDPDPEPEPQPPVLGQTKWFSSWYGNEYKPTHPEMNQMKLIFPRWSGRIPPVGSSQKLSEKDLTYLATQGPAGGHCVIDIEHTYPHAAYRGATLEDGSMEVLDHTLTELQRRRPDVQWSIYGLPLREYWGTLTPGSSAEQMWLQRNEDSAELMSKMDFFCPSIYRFYAHDDFKTYAEAMIKETRKYSSTKPVYPFIWPTFHPAGNPARALMTRQQWETVLNNTVPHADGVILWGDSIGPNAGGGWWDATVDAIWESRV